MPPARRLCWTTPMLSVSGSALGKNSIGDFHDPHDRNFTIFTLGLWLWELGDT